ncbi:hypothetical protein ACEPPN_007389 [Leptodophora sp. 'Broadleaf-Isolate-01']
MSILGWLGFPLSASYISIFCAIPLIPTCDVCGICPTPIHTHTPPIASASDDKLHDFVKQIASTTFWDTAISQAIVLESLGREIRRRRVPYRRLHNTWKLEFDSKLQARHWKALEPLNFVIDSLDTSAEELIAFQFHVSTSYAVLGVNLGFLPSRLDSNKRWYSFSSTSDALGVGYASFAAESIKQLDGLILRVEKIITRLQQTEASLNKLHQSLKIVDQNRKHDEDAQYFWVHLWWSRSESPHLIEGRDIKGIMDAHNLTLSKLDITVHYLRDKRTAWKNIIDGLNSAIKLSSGRTRDATLKRQLNLVNSLCEEYKTHSKIASQRVEENIKAAEEERKRGGPLQLESTRYNARPTHV